MLSTDDVVTHNDPAPDVTVPTLSDSGNGTVSTTSPVVRSILVSSALLPAVPDFTQSVS